MTDKTIAERLAEIDEEERREAAEKKEATNALRVRRYELKKACEQKYNGREGREFAIVEGVDGVLIELKKPDALQWMTFQKIPEKTQPDWERLYRSLTPEADWERVKDQVRNFPFVEPEIIHAIYEMLGKKREDTTKK